MQNLPKSSKPDLDRELAKLTIGYNQCKQDLRDAELQNEIILLGAKQLMRKLKRMARKSGCAKTQLICSTIFQDLKTIIKVSETHINKIIAK